jgi:hypothetical protein
MMTYLSFVGLAYDGSPVGRMQGMDGYRLFVLKSTCLMGAAANILIVVGSVSTWMRKYRLGFLVACAATVLAVLVLIPLGPGGTPLTPHAGHLSWAGSAGLLAYAAWKLSSPNMRRERMKDEG